MHLQMAFLILSLIHQICPLFRKKKPPEHNIIRNCHPSYIIDKLILSDYICIDMYTHSII